MGGSPTTTLDIDAPMVLLGLFYKADLRGNLWEEFPGVGGGVRETRDSFVYKK